MGEDREALLKAELNKLTRGNGGDGRGDRNYQGRMGGATGGGNMSSAFYKGMAEHSPANSFLGERLDSSRRSVGSNGSKGSKRSEEDPCRVVQVWALASPLPSIEEKIPVISRIILC